MKTKNLFLTGIVFFLSAASNTFAADLCVNEAGSGGCYASITAALAAASDGDRILIQPKTGGVPYVENLTVNKSVQLLSNQEGVMWGLTGNITVTPAIGRKITIMHMKNTSGNITASGNSPAGTRCKVDIMNCELTSGNINFDYNYFEVNVVANVISNGYVALRYGNVIGNNITSTSYTNQYTAYSYYVMLYYGTDAVATNDTLYVVGNIINNQSVTNTYYADMFVQSTSQFFYVTNNYIIKPGTSYYGMGMYFYTHKNSLLGTNVIQNNTYYDGGSSSSYTYPIYIAGSTSGQFDIKNNLAYAPNKPAGYIQYYVYSGTPTVAFSYNYAAPSGSLYGIVNNGTNNLSSNSSINITTGQLNAGSDAINGGYPDYTYYDVDLTVNDVGAYGGSFTLDNFFPITGAARVYFVRAPRTILQSATMNIRAESFDR